MNKIWIFLLVLLATATLVTAVQPTQQSNKIFLDPFYRASTTLNTNYNYNLSVNPPDKISKVLSAIINFKVYMTPTVTFNLTVNGQSCNNPTFTVSTTYASSGQGEVSFDCSNRITQAGNYSLVLRITSANTGAIQGWLDLTYMNNPIGNVEVSGTEYSPGDPATMFVQLKDSYGNAVQNGACYLDIWYPLNGSGVHPYTVQDAPMIQALGDDGIYYYDTTAPSQLGVYMLSAKCAYSYNWVWIYPETELTYYPIPSARTGTWIGSTQALNDKGDDVYERCDSTAGVACQSIYSFNTSTYGIITNITSVNLYFAGQGDIVGKTITFAYWNGTAYVNLPNIFTVVATGATITTPGETDLFVTNSIPASAIINNIVLIRYTGQTGLARLYNNWLSIALLSSTGTIQDVKGSSEMHITNLANASLGLINTALPAAVWNYTTRNLTYYQNFSTPQIDLTNYSRISNLTALDVWTYLTRNLTYYPPVNTSGINVTVDNNAVALAVWNATTRNLTYYNMTDTTNYTLIGSTVWSFATRNLTYFPTQVDMTNYTLINSGVWTYLTRNLTYYPTQQDLTNYTLINEGVWSYINRNLTYYEVNNISPSDIWTYVTRNLTYYPTQQDLTNYTVITQNVWSYANRSLTYYEVNNISASDVWNYINRTLTYYQVNNITAEDIWIYNNRTLTYYPTQTDATNYTLVADNVWNASARYVHGIIYS